MAKYSIEDTTLTGIADAIREKTGSSAEIKVEDMASAVSGLSAGAEWIDVKSLPSTYASESGEKIIKYLEVSSDISAIMLYSYTVGFGGKEYACMLRNETTGNFSSYIPDLGSATSRHQAEQVDTNIIAFTYDTQISYKYYFLLIEKCPYEN